MAQTYTGELTGIPSIQVNSKAPLDDRTIVDNLSDLTATGSDKIRNLYKGIIVYVLETKGLYVLTEVPKKSNLIESWKRIDGDASNINLSDYVKFEDLSGFLTASDVDDFVKVEDVENMVKGFVSESDLDLYVKTDDIVDFVKEEDLENDYAKKEDLVNFLTASDVDDFVRLSELNDILDEELVDRFVSQSDLDVYVKTEDLTDYVTTSELNARLAEINIPVVPTNVSAFTNDAGYLTEDTLPDFLKDSDLDGYVKTEDLENYIPKEDLEDLAKKSDLDGYVKREDAVEYLTSSDLDDYLRVSELPTNVSDFINDAGYLTDDTLPDFLKDSDLDGYVKVEDLADYIPKDELDRLAKKSDLDGYVKYEDASDYLTSSDLEGYVKSEDLLDYIPKDELDKLAKKSDLDGYVKVVDALDYITSDDLNGLASEQWVENQGYLKEADLPDYLKESDLDEYAKTSELPVVPENVSAFNNDAGYITSANLPTQGSFPTDSNLEDEPTNGFASVQDVMDYVEAYFEKKKDSIRYVYINGCPLDETPGDITLFVPYLLDESGTTEIEFYSAQELPLYDQNDNELPSYKLTMEIPEGYTISNFYVWSALSNEYQAKAYATNPRYSTRVIDDVTYNSYVRTPANDIVANGPLKYKIIITKQ